MTVYSPAGSSGRTKNPASVSYEQLHPDAILVAVTEAPATKRSRWIGNCALNSTRAANLGETRSSPILKKGQGRNTERGRMTTPSVRGANLVIVTGRTKGAHPKYGCPQNFYRGACANSLKERSDWLEDRLLSELQQAVMRPEVVDYAIGEFERQLQASLADP